MRTWGLCLPPGMAVVGLAGCVMVPSACYRATDRAKSFVLTLRAGAFSSS